VWRCAPRRPSVERDVSDLLAATRFLRSVGRSVGRSVRTLRSERDRWSAIVIILSANTRRATSDDGEVDRVVVRYDDDILLSARLRLFFPVTFRYNLDARPLSHALRDTLLVRISRAHEECDSFRHPSSRPGELCEEIESTTRGAWLLNNETFTLTTSRQQFV